MLEHELKFRVASFDEVESRLRELGCEPSPPAEEANLVFDDPPGSLARRGVLLRLRSSSAGVLLTVKTFVPDSSAKVRREHEGLLDCSLQEASAMLEALGYSAVCSYAKTRRTCRLGAASVCLDTLGFGRFVEVEAGSGEALFEAVDRLGFDPCDGTVLSYPALEREADADA